MSIEFTIKYEGREISIECTINSPEEDVGIMGPWVEDICGKYDDGSPVPEEILEKLEGRIQDAAAQIWYDAVSEPDPY